MKKQTALEQLYDWYADHNNWLRPEDKKHYEYQDILIKIREFKTMEKEQIIEAFNEGALDGLQLGEQFYKWVYGV
jgi:hypothetical protein